MTVKFFAYLRDPEFAGCKEMTLPVCSDVAQLGRNLSTRFGRKFHDEFFAEGETELGERVIVMVNGRRVEFLNGIHTPLRDTDLVQIFPVVAGG